MIINKFLTKLTQTSKSGTQNFGKQQDHHTRLQNLIPQTLPEPSKYLHMDSAITDEYRIFVKVTIFF
jgi:hypothetical protein